MKKKILRYISACLLAVAILSTVAFAAMEASKYIQTTVVGVTTKANGVIEFDCTITATDIYPDVGVRWLKIYEDGTHVATYDYEDPGYSYMMGHDDFSYTATVTHQGTVGKEYHATVCFFVGDEYSGGDGHTQGSAIVTAKK